MGTPMRGARCMIMSLPSTVVEAQRKARGKKGPRQKHRYVRTQSKGWTVLSGLVDRTRASRESDRRSCAHGRRTLQYVLGPAAILNMG
jgi:hypothetical protein